MLTPKSYFFIVSGTLGLLLAFSLIVRSYRSKAPLASLAVLIAAMSIELFTNFATGSGYVGRPGAVPFWLLGTYLVVPPSLFVIARHSIGLQPLRGRLVRWMYVPAAIEVLAESVLRLSRSPGSLVLTRSSAWFWFTEIIPAVAAIAIFSWWTWQLFKRTIGEKVLFRVHTRAVIILGYYALISILWFLEAALGITAMGLTEILLGVAMLAAGYEAFIQAGFFEKLSLVGVRSAPSWTYNDEESASRMVHLFSKEKLHCQPRFSLDELADALQLPDRYVSYLIGSRFSTNFAGLINRLRVEAVITKLRDPGERHKTILAIAYEAGFSSKSTFNLVFKSQTGMSPSQYLRSCGNDGAGS